MRILAQFALGLGQVFTSKTNLRSMIQRNSLSLGYLPNYFSGIPNCFSNKVYQKANKLMNTQLK